MRKVLLPHWKFWRHNCKLKMQEVHNLSRSSWKSFWEPTTKVFVTYCKYIGFNNVTTALFAPFPSILSDFCIMTEQGTILWVTFTFWQEALTRKAILRNSNFPSDTRLRFAPILKVTFTNLQRTLTWLNDWTARVHDRKGRKKWQNYLWNHSTLSYF